MFKSAAGENSPNLGNGVFNTDYRTRSSSTPTPEVLRGNGLSGRNLPIGSEDPYRSSLPPSYMPTDLVKIPQPMAYENMVIYLRSEAAQSMMRMMNDMRAQGLKLYIFSGYRDSQHQARLYAESVRRNGAGQKSVARPGRSEHLLGTTADVTNSSRYLMSRSFASTPEGRWLSCNGARYGWKMTVRPTSAIRSHADEPWHIRYLGAGASQREPGEIVPPCPPESDTQPRRGILSRIGGLLGLSRN